MPVKIRLMRVGAKKRPFFRVVAVDGQKKRTGAYLELLGTYNPLTEPKEIILKQDRVDGWLKKGAQPSEGFLRIIGKAPQRPPRKPKKEQKMAAPAEEAAKPGPKAEERIEAETPAEQAAAPAEAEVSATAEVTADKMVVSEESIAEAAEEEAKA